MIAVVPLFLLDALEMRARIEDGAATPFDVATVLALLKMGAAVLMGFAVGLGARSAAGTMKKSMGRGADDDDSPMLIHPLSGS